ncbi:sodium/hydrogen exchanger family protein [Hirsutella rhossiliensis]|uniref:Sodium/hydrogen exchanger family domain-containing protein n=1 Tax=Hirsutella rhossiliensis TaxID=111463 RepID=A0A9P8MTZ6_9HYPO|nr:sodium/hydrogen exchanger family domain-containing protein [Hirsutella rhossiliensis]KAH0961134.1 sodium/hydrogen exchanger family domain-containing protein [Hirsutella rhossiliensis]
MPNLDISELNIVLSVLGIFIVLYGIISVKIKQKWYLGEALPAVALGIALGPIAAKFLDSERWGSAEKGQTAEITLGVTRVMIGLQLVIAGYQLPAKYNFKRWKEMTMCLLPIMTIMWLCTTLCMLATVPKVTLLAALVIGSCVTCTDPILSQAIAKGPFADKFVARPLREIISSEAGANDGFGFPFLMLAVYLIRHADIPSAEEVGRLGGGVAVAMKNWFLETWLYIVLLSVVYGAVAGYGSCKVIKFALRRKWIDGESYLLFPAALGMFLVGTCGAIGTDDLLACFVAGNALNWDGKYLEETEQRHDEVNSCIDVLLNFGLTYGRLILLGLMILVFRRIPAILLSYKLMPAVVKDWKEALFMGYFGPIGAGAVFYLEHSRHLFPKAGQGDEEENDLARAIGPVVYWLVLFSIVVHGLSIPGLNLIYKYTGVKSIQDDAVEIRRVSMRVATPPNAVQGGKDTFIAYNRFSRPVFDPSSLPVSEDRNRSFEEHMPRNSYMRDEKVPPPENQYKWRLYPTLRAESERSEKQPTIRYAQ